MDPWTWLMEINGQSRRRRALSWSRAAPENLVALPKFLRFTVWKHASSLRLLFRPSVEYPLPPTNDQSWSYFPQQKCIRVRHECMLVLQKACSSLLVVVGELVCTSVLELCYNRLAFLPRRASNCTGAWRCISNKHSCSFS